MKRRAGDDPIYVNALVRPRTEMVASREKLDLDKPDDVVAAIQNGL